MLALHSYVIASVKIGSHEVMITDVHESHNGFVRTTAGIGSKFAVNTARFTVLDDYAVLADQAYTRLSAVTPAVNSSIASTGHIELPIQFDHSDFRLQRTTANAGLQSTINTLALSTVH
ncbi:hypothetical protein KKB10_03335 [Patescibacteria group bacterium]|nr:hypothetical protein [Patescibacteria group bacterium]